MTHRTVLAALLLLAAPPAFAAQLSDAAAQDEAPSEAAEAFRSILERHWQLRLEEDPVLAEQLGDEDGRGRLSDPSLEAHRKAIEARRGLLRDLTAIDAAALPEDERINHELLTFKLRDEVENAGPGDAYLTINTYWSPHTSLVRLAERTRLGDGEDVTSYLDRLEEMPAYLDAVIARLGAGVAAGWTQQCAAMAGFERTYETHLVENPRDSIFYQPFEGTEAATGRQKAKARALIARKVIPALAEFARFYEEDYAPSCRRAAGVGNLAGGEDYYAAKARSYTTTDLTPEEIHEIGLSEVARIRREMTEIARDEGYGSLAAYQEHLRTDEAYYPATAEERIAAASVIAKKMDGRLVDLFTVLPRMPYDIRPIPLDVAEGTTTAYYSRPAADGTRAGTYWINTTKLDTRPLYELEALTLHEAVPGHHLQIALAQELDLPAFRRFGGVTAFTEGWGLYAEKLGEEVGFYETPETDFGRLSYEMWRAARLVVDTGMHARGWSRREAIGFMLENTGLSENNIEREVDRYITWPGQALAYKIGEMKIRELRQRAEEELGDGFDLRRFHDAVLGNGSVPLSVLEREITRWIEAEGRG